MKTNSRKFNKLSQFGTVNPENKVMVHTANVQEIGVAISQSGSKKATTLEMVVPMSRSSLDSRRVATLTLNGHQARELFETLKEHYENSQK